MINQNLYKVVLTNIVIPGSGFDVARFERLEYATTEDRAKAQTLECLKQVHRLNVQSCDATFELLKQG